MNFPDPKRGKLFSVTASLLMQFSREALLWQFPAQAAGEKLAMLALALRPLLLQAGFAFLRR